MVTNLGCLNAVLLVDQLGGVVTEEEPNCIDVVHNEHKGRCDKSQGDRAAPCNKLWEESETSSQGKDAELKLNDPPLVLKLVLWLSRISNDVGGLLRRVRKRKFVRLSIRWSIQQQFDACTHSEQSVICLRISTSCEIQSSGEQIVSAILQQGGACDGSVMFII